MKYFNLVLIVIVAIILNSCKKEDQKFADGLVGTWRVTKNIYNGTEEDISQYGTWEYVFNKCKVKKDNCSGTEYKSSYSFPFDYSFTNNGEVGDELTIDFGSFGTDKYTIIEISDTKFTFSRAFASGNGSEDTYLEKQ